MATAERFFASDHPAAQGHFPGNPVIPGAVLLSEVLRAAQGQWGAGLSSCRILSAKFLAPVRPGDRLIMELSRAGPTRFHFSGTVGGRAVLRGEAVCDATPTAA